MGYFYCLPTKLIIFILTLVTLFDLLEPEFRARFENSLNSFLLALHSSLEAVMIKLTPVKPTRQVNNDG